jgi:hypothetical protein
MMDRQRWNFWKCTWFLKLFLEKQNCKVMHQLTFISYIPKS